MKYDLTSLKAKELAIVEIKEIFEKKLKKNLNLHRVSAPLFVHQDSGLQDNLSGVEKAVSFQCKALGGERFEVVQSLAKWKRLALKQFGFEKGEGIVTDMRAIRPDEEKLTPVHSVYVDQWDWEKVIGSEERHLDTLQETVKKIYQAIYEVHHEVAQEMAFLPETITFIHAEDLYKEYPTLTPKERESAICKREGAVFIVGIGGELGDGRPHDLRAADYDDWTTMTSASTRGLNGDLLVWNPILGEALELSSMGVRVDAAALSLQLLLCECEERAKLPWHELLLKGELPATIGGGIGQSRLCMFMLQSMHIKEVQLSSWPLSYELMTSVSL